MSVIHDGFTGDATAARKRVAVAYANASTATGYMVGDIRGAYLMGSGTADRTYKANTLTENGTVPSAAVASGAELVGYGPFTGSNYFSRTHDADFDFGSGDFYCMMWAKLGGAQSSKDFFG